jgi:hypothetical protein
MIDENLRSDVLKILEDEQNQLIGALESQTNLTVPETITVVETEQNSDGTLTEKVTEQPSNYINEGVDSELRSKFANEAETLQAFCKIIDDEIISLNNQINVKKEQIVILSDEAATGNCWPGIAYSGGIFSFLGTFYGTNVTVKEEVENLRIYPNVAGPTARYDILNPFEPDSVNNLTPEYSGYGYRNLQDPNFYKNKDRTLTGNKVDGSGDNIGNGRFDISETQSDHNARVISVFRTYSGATNPARCVGIGTSIRVLYNEIIDLRKQRDSLREDLNTIKENKSEKELAAWGSKRIDNQIVARETKNLGAIASVKNYNTDVTINADATVLYLDVGDPDSYSGIGTIWYDRSGYGNNATIYPIGTSISYSISDGNYFTFNAIDQYVQTGIKTTNQANVLGVGTTWTMETWFKVNGGPSSIFNSVVSAAGTVRPISGIITGITTTSIAVGQNVVGLSTIVSVGTTVTAIGIGSVYISPKSLNNDTVSSTFSFGNYLNYANTIVDVNSTSTSTNMLGVSYGQSGIFSGISKNRLIYTVSSGAATTTLVGSAITNGAWYHGVVVRNGTNNTKLYVNGVGVATYSGDVALGTASTTTTKIAAWTDENIYSNISVSVVKVYQRSYTDDEVKNKFDASRGRYGIIGT